MKGWLGCCVVLVIGCSDGSPAPANSGPCKGKAAGAACDDGNACTSNDACTATGACQGKTVECPDDGVTCTTAACDPKQGCSHQLDPKSCLIGGVCHPEGAVAVNTPCKV